MGANPNKAIGPSGEIFVTTNNFICAETDTQFRGYAKKFGAFSKINHHRSLLRRVLPFFTIQNVANAADAPEVKKTALTTFTQAQNTSLLETSDGLYSGSL